jgi:hypothetical protein
MRIICIALSFLIATMVCRSQNAVTLSGTAPASCSGQSCSFVFSRVTLVTGSVACPGNTSTTYKPLNASSPSCSPLYLDTTAAGLTTCYVMRVMQNGAVVGQPSNSVGPFVLPKVAAASSKQIAKETKQ